LEPGGRSGKAPHAYNTEVFVMIFEGRVSLTLDDDCHLLRRGDAITLQPGTLHLWEHSGTERSCLLIVLARSASEEKR
jgi:uncharacterized cupin superfamily protein